MTSQKINQSELINHTQLKSVLYKHEITIFLYYLYRKKFMTETKDVKYIINKIAPQTQMILLKLGSLYKGTLEQTYSWQNLTKRISSRNRNFLRPQILIINL